MFIFIVDFVVVRNAIGKQDRSISSNNLSSKPLIHGLSLQVF
jgi:hypothetical protein